MRKILLTIALTIGIAGCAALTSAPPSQARSVAEAIQAVTLAEKGLDIYVQSGKADQAVLAQLKILVPAVHNSLKQVEAAQSSGNSALQAAALAAFNESMAALVSYENLRGVSH